MSVFIVAPIDSHAILVLVAQSLQLLLISTFLVKRGQLPLHIRLGVVDAPSRAKA